MAMDDRAAFDLTLVVLRSPARRHFLRLIGGLLGAPALLAACTAETRRFAVTIQGPNVAWYQPAALTIPQGATVVWVNRDIYPHTVTCNPTLAQEGGGVSQLPQGAAPWDSGDLYTGEQWAYTFTTPGPYLYYSRRDEVNHLLGLITVT